MPDVHLGPLTAADFAPFFEELWGFRPFHWQERLLRRVREEGWPSTLDLPTGAGKTATLDVALFALALDAFERPGARRQARRIVLVVDRRVVVDQAYERAVNLARRLAEAEDGVLLHVANALRALSGDQDGFPVVPAILRGGMPREAQWARSPSQPVVLVSTVDQVGSRLLFRGYGVSDGMRPVHAGLLGRDVLYLLDEVHLARPFEETLDAVARWYSQPGVPHAEREVPKNDAAEPALLPRPLTFVRMSATVADGATDRFFRLGPADRENARLRQRLEASKRAVLRRVTTPRDPAKVTEALVRAAVREVERLGNGAHSAVAIIVNRVNTAGRIAALARERLPDAWDVTLLTGRMRPLDRLEKQAGVLERVRAGRRRTEQDRRLLLVSTQAVEAGADFDFDVLVTECASLDALRQRFGRLDRMGDLRVTEAVVMVGSSCVDEKAGPDPIYGEALRATWHWLERVGQMSSEHDAKVVDFGIDAIGKMLADEDQGLVVKLLAPRGHAPVLVGSHLDRWAQTSPAPAADPDIAPFLHGVGRGAPEVQIVWRGDIEEAHLVQEGVVRSLLEIVRPSALEALSVPLWAARRWLGVVAARRKRSSPRKAEGVFHGDLTDVEGAAPSQEIDQEGFAPVVLWRGRDTTIGRRSEDLRPGDTVVVPATYGGINPVSASWDPDATEAVLDRGDEAQLLQRGRAVLRWSSAAICGWGQHLPAELKDGPAVQEWELAEQGGRAERNAFQEWRSAVLLAAAVPEWVRLALGVLSRGDRTSRVELSLAGAGPDLPYGGAAGGEVSDEGTSTWRATWGTKRVSLEELKPLMSLPSLREVVVAEALQGEATTEDDEGSFLGNPVPLKTHLAGVRNIATRFAVALGLPSEITEDLALAAWLHDLGKADRRFQVLLHGGDVVREATAEEPLAKSAVPAGDREARRRARERSGYPRGARHELMSVALVEDDEDLRARAHDWDLVLHLVGSHHGWCRPLGPPVLDPEPVEVQAVFDGRVLVGSSNHCLSRIDRGVPERFWNLVRRYGWWGLAWLEAIVRLADHRESEEASGA